MSGSTVPGTLEGTHQVVSFAPGVGIAGASDFETASGFGDDGGAFGRTASVANRQRGNSQRQERPNFAGTCILAGNQ
jgi:hypothetical protein